VLSFLAACGGTETPLSKANIVGVVSFIGTDQPKTLQATVACANPAHQYATAAQANGSYELSVVPGIYDCTATSLPQKRSYRVQVVEGLISHVNFLLCAAGCPGAFQVCGPAYPHAHYAPCSGTGALGDSSPDDTARHVPMSAAVPGGLSVPRAPTVLANVQPHLSFDRCFSFGCAPGGIVINGQIHIYFIDWVPTGYCLLDCSTTPNGGLEAAYKDILADMGDVLINEANPFRNTLAQYGVNVSGPAAPNQGVIAISSWTDTRPYESSAPGTGLAGTQARPLQQADIEDEIDHARQVSDWPASSPVAPTVISNLFVVLTARNVESCARTNPPCSFPLPQASSYYCAYHDFTEDTAGEPIVYIYLPDGATRPCNVSTAVIGPYSNLGLNTTEDTFSHELAETLTDPYLNAWFDDTDHKEIGDKCEGVFATLAPDGSDFTLPSGGPPLIIQEEWSNALGACSLT
jgi:hypothetical protein